jgi:hypothetical protein
MNERITIWVAGGLFVAGCAEPAHLQRSYGASTHQAFTTQADLERPSVAEHATALTGEEGLALRQRVAEATSDEATGQTVSDVER